MNSLPPTLELQPPGFSPHRKPVDTRNLVSWV